MILVADYRDDKSTKEPMDFRQNVYNQLERMNIFESNASVFFSVAVDALEGLMASRMDELYVEEIKGINIIQINTDGRPIGVDSQQWVSFQKARLKKMALIRLLDRKGFLPEGSMIWDEGDDDDDESDDFDTQVD